MVMVIKTTNIVYSVSIDIFNFPATHRGVAVDSYRWEHTGTVMQR